MHSFFLSLSLPLGDSENAKPSLFDKSRKKAIFEQKILKDRKDECFKLKGQKE